MFLEVGKDFSTWVKDRIEKYEFTEGVDFINFPKNWESDSRQLMEYHITLDMAKELSMVERTEKGKQARQYFIEAEKRLRANDVAYADRQADREEQAGQCEAIDGNAAK